MKTVFITGVGRGLGKEFFTQLNAGGHRVYGLYRNPEQYEELSALKNNFSELILADVSSDDCIKTIRESVNDTSIDLVINNAGIGGTGMSLEETSSQEIIDLLQVHCLGVLRVMKALKSNLLSGESPCVINLNSRFGSITHQYKGSFRHLEVSYSYRIAKAAQNMLSNCLRHELGDKAEFVCVTPGRVRTANAQKDAVLSAQEAVGNILGTWEQGTLKSRNGILFPPDDVTEW